VWPRLVSFAYKLVNQGNKIFLKKGSGVVRDEMLTFWVSTSFPRRLRGADRSLLVVAAPVHAYVLTRSAVVPILVPDLERLGQGARLQLMAAVVELEEPEVRTLVGPVRDPLLLAGPPQVILVEVGRDPGFLLCPVEDFPVGVAGGACPDAPVVEDPVADLRRHEEGEALDHVDLILQVIVVDEPRVEVVVPFSARRVADLGLRLGQVVREGDSVLLVADVAKWPARGAASGEGEKSDDDGGLAAEHGVLLPESIRNAGWLSLGFSSSVCLDAPFAHHSR